MFRKLRSVFIEKLSRTSGDLLKRRVQVEGEDLWIIDPDAACAMFKKRKRLGCVAGIMSFINCLLLFSLANIVERRVRPYVCFIV